MLLMAMAKLHWLAINQGYSKVVAGTTVLIGLALEHAGIWKKNRLAVLSVSVALWTAWVALKEIKERPEISGSPGNNQDNSYENLYKPSYINGGLFYLSDTFAK